MPLHFAPTDYWEPKIGILNQPTRRVRVKKNKKQRHPPPMPPILWWSFAPAPIKERTPVRPDSELDALNWNQVERRRPAGRRHRFPFHSRVNLLAHAGLRRNKRRTSQREPSSQFTHRQERLRRKRFSLAKPPFPCNDGGRCIFLFRNAFQVRRPVPPFNEAAVTGSAPRRIMGADPGRR